MFAVFETGGKQYRVTVGDEIQIEKLPGDLGAEVVFDRLLMVSRDSDVRVGQPVIDGATVHGTITEQALPKKARLALGSQRRTGLGPKVRVFKHKQRQRYNKTYGHRQPFTRVKITDIRIG